MANNSYNAGDLTLSINAIADDTLKRIDMLANRLSFIESSLKHIAGTSKSVSKSSYIKNEKSSGYGSLLYLGKWTAVIAASRRLGRFMGDLVQAGSDYNETLNLWQVAMRNNLDVADQFVSKMQKAYGISTKTLMNAQAVFKNMIGSLGQISDETAYALSEALVQMSADYASLYNRTIESALQNMQSMLAGQVRPIRSAGLDITETTLYQYYQQLGGTKSMRQLNRTEKQLLSILAVFNQMGSAGALGDMSKTLNEFANQSRMMTEYWVELKTWSGLLLKDLIDEWGLLIKINAALITATEVVKAIAISRGIGNENYLTGLFETTEATNGAVDELQGKLLDFDKFRSLEGASSSPLAIDEKLLQAITGYSSKIDQSKNDAQILAETWLSILGFTKDTNGEFATTEENLESIQNKFKSILGAVSAISTFLFAKSAFKKGWLPIFLSVVANAYATNETFRTSINKLAKSLGNVLLPLLEASTNVLTALTSASAPIVEIFSNAILFLDEIGALEPIIWTIISTFAVFKSLKLVDYIDKLIFGFGKLFLQAGSSLNSLEKQKRGFAHLSLAVMVLAGTLQGAWLIFQNWGDMSVWQKIISIAGLATAAILGLALAFGAFQSTLSMGLAAAGIVAGIAAVAASIATIKKDINVPMYANGASDIDGGTLFVAGEMGKTEAVYTGSNGKTNVANIQQMKVAYKQALAEWWTTAKNDVPSFQGVSDSGIYTIVDGEARRRGKKFVNV